MPHLLAPHHAAIRRVISVPLLLVLFYTDAPAQETASPPEGVLRPFGSDQEAADYLYGRLLERDSLRRARIARCEGNAEVRVYRTDSGPFGADSADAPSILHGRVTWEETGEPLPGATAVELNSLRGSAADPDGRFSFDVPAERIRSNSVVTVHATDIGFIEAKTSIVLKPGESAEIQVRLCLDDDVYVDYVSSPTIPSTTPQHESVDDGGLLKRIGDHLVILRRGKLYTVYVGGDRLEVVDVTPTFGQTIDLDDIYSTRLFSGASGALVGYGEHRGCARVGIHAPDDRWRRRVHRVHAVPNARYSIWEDPAAHLVDGRLVLFSSYFLPLDEAKPRSLWSLAPSLRPGKGTADHDAHAAEDCGDAWSDLRDDLCDSDCDDDQRIPTAVTSTRFFRPARDVAPAVEQAIHALTTCEFTGPEVDCSAVAIPGPAEPVVYVSPRAVFVSVAYPPDPADATQGLTLIYRMPVDGSAPEAQWVRGRQGGRFSFMESEDGHLNVLVYASNGWVGPFEESGPYRLALTRFPVSRFKQGGTVPDSCYLPLPFHWSGTLKVRFVDRYLLLGSGAGWRAPDNDRPSELLVVDVQTGAIHRLPVKHGVDRIETMGSAALLAGSTSRNLHLTTVRLDAEPSVVDHRVVRRVLDERTESHGIYYLPQSAERGIVAVALERHRYSDGQRRSASILYFDSHSLRLSVLGRLESRRKDSSLEHAGSGYDTVQPVFVEERILGLFGSEIIEGRIQGNRLREVRRISLD